MHFTSGHLVDMAGRARVVLLLLWILLAWGTSTTPGAQAVEPDAKDLETLRLRQHLDLVYHRVGERELHLDLWTPEDTQTSRPALVVVHGGGWLKGDKTKFHPLAKALAERGYVTAAIEYRLGGEAKFPAAVHDCHAAVRWLRRHADQYGIDPQRIGAVGGSAGGHLVGLLATAADHPDLNGAGDAATSSRVQAAVVLAGPWQLTTGSVAERSRSQPSSNANQWLGKTIDEAPDLYELASPFTHLSRETCPTLFMTGELDRPERNREARARLKELGIATGIQVYENGKHGCWNREPWRTSMILDMDAFFSTVFGRDTELAPWVERGPHFGNTTYQKPRRLVLALSESEGGGVKLPRIYSSVGSISGAAASSPAAEAPVSLNLKPQPDHWVIEAPAGTDRVVIEVVEPFAGWSLPPIVSSAPGPRPERDEAGEEDDAGRRTGGTTAPALTLYAHHARTEGKVIRYEPQPHKNCVGYWAKAEDSASWRCYVEQPGQYEVVIWQGCGKGQGGSRVRLKAGEQQLDFVVEDTGHFQNFKPRRIGTFDFETPGVYTLQIACLKKAANAVMDVQKIELLRVSETNSTVEP